MCLPLLCSFVLNHKSISYFYSSVPCSRLLSLVVATLSRLCSNIMISMLQSLNSTVIKSILFSLESILISKCYSDHLIKRPGLSAQFYHHRKGRDHLRLYAYTSKIPIKCHLCHLAIFIHTLTLLFWNFSHNLLVEK